MSVEQAARRIAAIAAIVTESRADAERVRTVMHELRQWYIESEDE